MNNKYQKIFVGVVFALLCVPLTYMIGISETTQLSGKERIVEKPDIHEKSFAKKQYQPFFELWWNSHFGFRKTMLKTKNSIYDIANFGVIHSGASSTVIQGKNNYLYGRHYFNSFSKNCLPVPKELEKVKELKDVLKKKNIDLYVILAPNKAVTYPDFMPSRYKYFLGEDCGYYDKLEQKIHEFGVPVFNAQRLASNIRKNEKYQPFSLTGTHWNYYGAGRTVQESAKQFGWANLKISEVRGSNAPYFMETDIARLLNRWFAYEPKQTFYKPIFEKVMPLRGGTTIIGNSFSSEYKHMFVDAGLSDGSPYHFENNPLVVTDVPNILKSKRVILIYTDNAIAQELNGQFYKKLDFLLDNIKYVVQYKFSDKKIPGNMGLSGVSNPEQWGAWSDGNMVEFTFNNIQKSNLIVKFDTRAFLMKQRDFQNVDVYVNDKWVAKWQYKMGKPTPNTILEIPSSQIKNGAFKIKMKIENPISPKDVDNNSKDTRKIAIGFMSLKIETK